MSVKIEGLEELLVKFDSLEDTKEITKAMGKACSLVERAAKQKAPKGRTGELRNSITSKVDKNSDNIVGTIFTPLHYAPYVEFGTGLFAESGGRTDVPWHYQDEQGEWHTTSGMHPNPYMRPALFENQDKIIRMLKEGIIEE